MGESEIANVLRKCSLTGAWYGSDLKTIFDANFMGDSPLHTVCSWGELDAVKLLVQAGADINAVGDLGATPLFNAVIGGNIDVVAFLVSRGANMNIIDDTGNSAFSFAKKNNMAAEMLRLLKS